MTWQEKYLNKFYRNRQGWMDGTTEFHQLCKATILPSGRILEVGAGPSNRTSAFLATLGELHGVDIDPDISTNRSLVSSAILRGGQFPFEDDSFDACVSNYVLEHVDDPGRHLSE